MAHFPLSPAASPRLPCVDRHMRVEARKALAGAVSTGLHAYDHAAALRRFPRLTHETICSETPDAAQIILRELERALRGERMRLGHWTHGLNRHIALVTVYRAEKARASRILASVRAKKSRSGAAT
jgi:hypothetical protein